MSERHLRNGFNVGNGSFSEGDRCMVGERPGTIASVFQDGEAEVNFFDDTCGIFKWRQIMPDTSSPPPPPPQHHEKVNHPAHYGGAENTYEAIKIIEAWNLNFCLGNAIKYILRAGKKDKNHVQDLEKALWYLSRELSQFKKVPPQ